MFCHAFPVDVTARRSLPSLTDFPLYFSAVGMMSRTPRRSKGRTPKRASAKTASSKETRLKPLRLHATEETASGKRASNRTYAMSFLDNDTLPSGKSRSVDALPPIVQASETTSGDARDSSLLLSPSPTAAPIRTEALPAATKGPPSVPRHRSVASRDGGIGGKRRSGTPGQQMLSQVQGSDSHITASQHKHRSDAVLTADNTSAHPKRGARPAAAVRAVEEVRTLALPRPLKKSVPALVFGGAADPDADEYDLAGFVDGVTRPTPPPTRKPPPRPRSSKSGAPSSYEWDASLSAVHCRAASRADSTSHYELPPVKPDGPKAKPSARPSVQFSAFDFGTVGTFGTTQRSSLGAQPFSLCELGSMLDYSPAEGKEAPPFTSLIEQQSSEDVRECGESNDGSDTTTHPGSLYRIAGFDVYELSFSRLVAQSSLLGSMRKVPSEVAAASPPPNPDAPDPRYRRYTRSEVKAAFVSRKNDHEKHQRVGTRKAKDAYLDFKSSVPAPLPQPDMESPVQRRAESVVCEPFDFAKLHNWQLSDAQWVASPKEESL